MFERFTDRARQVLVLAQEEAIALSHNFLGTEHELLGMLKLDGGIAPMVLGEFNVTYDRTRELALSALEQQGIPRPTIDPAEALASIGIDLDEIRKRAEETFGVGSFHYPKPPFTPRAKKVLELSLREALMLGHFYIGTEHLLLGVIAETEGLAGQALVAQGADLRAMRVRTIEIAAPDRARAFAVNTEVGELNRRVGRLTGEQHDAAAAIVKNLFGATMEAQQRELNDTAPFRQRAAEEMEAALQAARDALAGAGIVLPDA